VFETTVRVSTKTYPGGKRRIHIVRLFAADLELKMSMGRVQTRGRTYRALSITIDEVRQLWLREAKPCWIGDRRYCLGPDTFPNKRSSGILDQRRAEMLASPREREDIGGRCRVEQDLRDELKG